MRREFPFFRNSTIDTRPLCGGTLVLQESPGRERRAKFEVPESNLSALYGCELTQPDSFRTSFCRKKKPTARHLLIRHLSIVHFKASCRGAAGTWTFKAARLMVPCHCDACSYAITGGGSGRRRVWLSRKQGLPAEVRAKTHTGE